MNFPELEDKEVHIWVFGDPNPIRATRCVDIKDRGAVVMDSGLSLSNVHTKLASVVRAQYASKGLLDASAIEDEATYGQKRTSLQVARVGRATVLCATSNQVVGINVQKITRSTRETTKAAQYLSSRTLKTIKRNAVMQGLYPFALLYAQRLAFARALRLRPLADMDRYNPLFKDTDEAYLKCGSWTRTVGGHLLRTIMFGGKYVGVVCCSVLTKRVVLFDTLGSKKYALPTPDDRVAKDAQWAVL